MLFAPFAASLVGACAPALPESTAAPGPVTSGAALPLKHAPRPTVPAITAGDLMTRLYIVADDSMMGRQAGTIGNVKATDYIAAEVRRMGLEPAGENGTYFQTVPLVRREFDAASGLSAGGTALRAGADYLLRDQGAGARSLAGVQSVYGGVWGDEAAMIAPGAAAGKLVIIAAPQGPDGRPQWNIRRQALARYPAAAGIAVVGLEAVPAATQAALRQPGLGVARPNPAPVPTFLWVSENGARALLGAAPAGLRAGAAGRAVQGSVRFTEKSAAAPARNVVAILRGSNPAVSGQYVAIGAHSDHEGIAAMAVDHDSLLAFNRVIRPQGANDDPREPTAAEWARIQAMRDELRRAGLPRRDSIFNGANDDGSGVVTTLEIAEALASAPQRPERSALFVWHTAEEEGLLGSEYFTDNPTVPRESIVAQLNMDMVGRGSAQDIPGGGPRYLQVIGSRRLSTQLGDILGATNARLPEPMEIDYSFDAPGHPLNRYCRSDHYMYARYGIPITYFSLGYHPEYHMVTDEAQYIDYEHMARVGRLVQDVAVAVANADQRLVVDKPKLEPNAPCRQ